MNDLRFSRFAAAALFSLSLTAVACGGDDATPSGDAPDKFGFAKGVTTVVGDGKGGSAYVTPDTPDGCVDVFGECVKPQEKCGDDARADVVVDSNGKVVDVICYPTTDSPPVVDGQGNVDLDKQNGGVVSVDGTVDGNVSSAGNNVTVYGDGPDTSVIGGDVTATGNNFAMRGVTVKGDVHITANNGALVLSVIEGDVIYEGNNFVMADTTVLGSVKITGNNAKLLGNAIAGTLSVDGKEAICDGNHQRLESGALGDALSCN